MRRASLLLVGVLGGCGGATGGADAGAMDAAGGVGDGAAAMDGGADAADPCAGRVAADGGGACVATVNGRLVDEAGQALGARLVSFCAVACYFGKTAADGTFAIPVGVAVDYATFAVELHAAPDRASSYWPPPPLALATDSTPRYAAPLVAPALPSTGPTLLLDGSAQTLTSGDLTLTLAAATKVDVAAEDFSTSGARLRVVDTTALQPTLAAAGFAAQPPFDALYAAAPFEARFAPPAGLTVANTHALPAGAAVDVFALHGLLGTTPPAGRFDRVAGAHVGSDGRTIALDPGEGLPALTWIGLRRR